MSRIINAKPTTGLLIRYYYYYHPKQQQQQQQQQQHRFLRCAHSYYYGGTSGRCFVSSSSFHLVDDGTDDEPTNNPNNITNNMDGTCNMKYTMIKNTNNNTKKVLTNYCNNRFSSTNSNNYHRCHQVLPVGSKRYYTTSSIVWKNDTTTNTTTNNEVLKFSAMSDDWWDATKNPLISMNVIRMKYIQQIVMKYYHNTTASANTTSNTAKKPTMILPLNGLSILDIGCGGGLVCESVARLGATTVYGIDLSKELITAANNHLEQSADADVLKKRITYIGGKTVTEFLQQPEHGRNWFDIICCLEVIEHVDDNNVETLLQPAIELLRPGGILFISTMNRTIQSYLITILGAEYVMRYLPIGTHNWNQYLSPNEVNTKIQQSIPQNNNNNEIIRMEQLDVTGMVLKSPPPIPSTLLNWNTSSSNSSSSNSSSIGTWDWKLDPTDTNVNWIGCYQKKVVV